jgi:hypothetical protein
MIATTGVPRWITSQLPVEQWHAYIEDPTLADAILARLIHNSHRLALKGDSMRKQRTNPIERRPRARSSASSAVTVYRFDAKTFQEGLRHIELAKCH